MLFEAASDIGRDTDGVFLVITGICIVLLVVITFLMVYFVSRYSRRKNPEAAYIEGNTFLEVSWTTGGVVLVFFMFYLGWGGYKARTQVPEGAVEVDVTGRMWAWTFAYANGKESGTLVVPVGEPVRLALRSADVIHSVYIPAFRVKQDVVPGSEKVLWFTPERTGEFDLFCAEYCGTGHSRMITTVEVLAGEDFEGWYTALAVPTGRELYESKGCSGCHTVDGSAGIGPTWKGLYGREAVVVTGGRERTVTADEEYVRRSILDPASDVVKGYPPIMPALDLDEEEVDGLVGYIKSLAAAPEPKAEEAPEPVEPVPVRKEAAPEKKEEKAPEPVPAKPKPEPVEPAPVPAEVKPEPRPAPEPEPVEPSPPAEEEPAEKAPAVEPEPAVEEAAPPAVEGAGEEGMEEAAPEPVEAEEAGPEPAPAPAGPEPGEEAAGEGMEAEAEPEAVEGPSLEPSRGEVLFREKACIGCHTLDGSPLVGPTWKGLYGKEEVVVTDGEKRTVTVDEEYIRRSIEEPNADIVEGYPPSMPAVELSDDEVSALVDLIKALE